MLFGLLTIQRGKLFHSLLTNPDGSTCIKYGMPCGANNRDAMYSFAKTGTLSDDPQAFLVAFGVNHEVTGKATYLNSSVYWLKKQLGVAAFTSEMMVGSARRYIPDHPDADSLYAICIARECGNEPFCIEVPSEFSGVLLSEQIFIMFRAYLESTTNVGPLAKELVLSRILKFTP